MTHKMRKIIIFILVALILVLFCLQFIIRKYSIKSSKRLLYLSLHQGTIDEVVFVFKRNGIDYTIGNLNNYKEYDLFDRSGWAVTEQLAEEYAVSEKVNKLCNEFDIIMIGDSIPFGWPFYMASKRRKCKAKLVLQVTQRFNFGAVDMHAYLAMMHYLTKNLNVFWLPNNPYEIFFLNAHKIVPKLERTILIRPFGVSYYPGEPVYQKKTIIYSLLGIELIREVLSNNNMLINKYEIYSNQTYGGPLTM